MIELIPGYETQQKVSVVNNTESDINDEIATQAEEEPGWILNQLTLSGANMVLLFSRNIEIIVEP